MNPENNNNQPIQPSPDQSDESLLSSPSTQPPTQSGGINVTRPDINVPIPKMSSPNFGRPDSSNGQSNPVSQPTMSPPPKKSKKGLIIALIILIILATAGAAYYFLVMSKDSSTNQASPASTESKQTEETPSELIKTTYTTHEKQSQNPVKISVKHPADWKVEQAEDEDVDDFITSGDMKIISPSGNVLRFQDVSRGGYGGDCTEAVDVTLVKRIPTKAEGYIFEQVQSNSSESDEYVRGLEFRKLNDENNVYLDEYTDKAIKKFDSLKEGDTFSGDCHAIYHYPDIRNIEKDATLFVVVEDDTSESITYDQIKDDTEFIAMLQSFKVEEE